ncbi:hypothetical protein WJX72_007861 [[Myrmecia] bisecta]|uniref:Uncharacterized protein n=1 Tax=[Myrmecia] bisecta TaxID=41462 RepID=A0AAW1Q5Q8_9CHLO
MAACGVNAIGHKVRFHLHAFLALVLYMMALPFMVANHEQGVFVVSPAYVAVHFLISVVLPALLVYKWDQQARRMFLLRTRQMAKCAPLADGHRSTGTSTYSGSTH